MLKRVMIGLFVISGVAMLRTEAIAGNACVVRCGGDCCFWSGSIEFAVDGAGCGGFAVDGCEFTVAIAASAWWNYCGNPGQDVSPPVNVKIVAERMTEQIPTGSVICDDRGYCTAEGQTDVSDTGPFDDQCAERNRNFVSRAQVPQEFDYMVTFSDAETKGVLGTQTGHCSDTDGLPPAWIRRSGPARDQYACSTK